MFFPQDPFVQKPHLILGVKPVLAAVHNRETGVVLSRKAADGRRQCQIVTASIENLRRCRPVNGVVSNITEILPGQVLAECRVYHAFGFQFLFRDACPMHHVGDQLLHIDDGRNEICLLYHAVYPGVHAEIRADAVRDQKSRFS